MLENTRAIKLTESDKEASPTTVSPATLTCRHSDLHFSRDAKIKRSALCTFTRCNKTTVHSVITAEVKRNGGQESRHLFQQRVAPFRGKPKRLVPFQRTRKTQRRGEAGAQADSCPQLPAVSHERTSRSQP